MELLISLLLFMYEFKRDNMSFNCFLNAFGVLLSDLVNCNRSMNKYVQKYLN